MPWTEIHFHNTGEVGTCCRAPIGSHDLGNSSQDPLKVWHGKKFVRLRRLVAQEKLENAGCSTCVDLSLGVVNDFPKLPLEATQKVRDNYFLALKGNIEAKNLPLCVYFQQSYKCNMNCPYCIQANERCSNPKVMEPFPIEAFKRIYKAFFEYAFSFKFVGGEVFTNDNFYKFLNVINPKRNPTCQIEIITNGTFIDKAIPSLSKFTKVKLHVSLDASTKETYMKVRGGDWDKLLSNFKLFLQYGETHGLDWNVRLSNIIMKSNIHELADMVKFAISEGASAGFGIIYGTKFRTENIFLYPELLEGINYEESFREVKEELDSLPKLQWIKQALKTLKGIRMYLETNPRSSLNMPEYKVRRIWLEKVCHFNNCSHKETYSLKRAFRLAREGKLLYLTKRVIEKAFF